MGYTLTEIRNALAETIQSYTEAHIYTYAQVSSKGEFPAVIIEPRSADFEGAFQRGLDAWDFYLYVLVNGANEKQAQIKLDSLVTGEGPSSIREAIDDHENLGLSGGVTASVRSMFGYGGSFEWSSVEHIGAILRVRVLISP